MRVLAIAGIAALTLFAVAPAHAHHSFAMFDTKKTMTLKGVIREFQWTNPHTWIQIMVVNDRGVEEEWGIEHSAINALARRGWTRGTFKPGEQVTMVINPIKSGGKGGAFVSATKADGTIWTGNGRSTAQTEAQP